MKRALDVMGALAALLLFSPVIAAVAAAILLRLGRPVLFVQQRPGRDGVPFRLYKFRTLTEARDPAGRLLEDRYRSTRLGEFLRRSSLDELPEFINVLRGEMSLVGPRPLLMEYLSLYTSEQKRRHAVRPGITGWAQVNGRNAISWEQKFAFDLWYVEHQSLALDLKILALTVWRVLRREGINEPGHATSTPFRGSAGRAT